MPAIEIKKDIHWIGAVDFNLRNFHGYSLARRGTTYNAFLIMDDEITLVDTVAAKFTSEMLHHIRQVVDPAKIDTIIVNHVEPDHSGALKTIVEEVQPKRIVCSPMGKQTMIEHYHQQDWPYEAVKTGGSITLGKRTVQFMETRMLHWPDSMFSYIPEDKLLFSSDAFGQNWASTERFDDEVDLQELLKEASHYYANIVLPFSNLVQKVLAKVADLGLDIDMIAPDHGLIWRSHPDKILSAYDAFSRQVPKRKAVIVYDTMWHSTEKMANALTEALVERGVSVKPMSLKAFHHSDVMAEVIDAAAVLVGSPTHNNSMMPLVADVLTYMKGLKPVKKVAAAFGSYGWSGEAVKHVTEKLAEMKFDIVEPGVRSKFVPGHDKLAECKQLGYAVADAIDRAMVDAQEA